MTQHHDSSLVATLPIDDPALVLRPTHFNDLRPSYLIGTIVIAGCSLHAEAIEVTTNQDGVQEAVEPDWQSDLDRIGEVGGSDGPLSTVTIQGRQYVLYCTPYAD